MALVHFLTWVCLLFHKPDKPRVKEGCQFMTVPDAIAHQTPLNCCPVHTNRKLARHRICNWTLSSLGALWLVGVKAFVGVTAYMRTSTPRQDVTHCSCCYA